jgi:hypothetical protein
MGENVRLLNNLFSITYCNLPSESGRFRRIWRRIGGSSLYMPLKGAK